MDAIESDEYGKAKINYDKCVSCGMCLVNCPFGAIADKSQIFQVIQTVIINKQLEAEDAKKEAKIDDTDIANAKKINAKE